MTIAEQFESLIADVLNGSDQRPFAEVDKVSLRMLRNLVDRELRKREVPEMEGA